MDSHKKSAQKTAFLSLVSNAGLAVAKGFTGVLGHSDAMIADAIESTTDVFASLLVLFGLNYSSKPADENHPYGHGKAEALVTFAVVGFLLISATIIAIESIRNLQQPQEKPEVFTLYVLGVIILIKEFSYRYVKQKRNRNGELKKLEMPGHLVDEGGRCYALNMSIESVIERHSAYPGQWRARKRPQSEFESVRQSTTESCEPRARTRASRSGRTTTRDRQGSPRSRRRARPAHCRGFAAARAPECSRVRTAAREEW
jgi:hypothetical protein